jgi:hypothetical protein
MKSDEIRFMSCCNGTKKVQRQQQLIDLGDAFSWNIKLIKRIEIRWRTLHDAARALSNENNNYPNHNTQFRSAPL